MISKDFLKDLFSKGEIGEVIQALLEAARHQEADVQQEICTQSNRFNNLEREFRLGKLDTNEYNKEFARISAALWNIISQWPDTSAFRKKSLSDYHRHTCDRSEQSTTFQVFFEKSGVSKKHFFGLVGGELQAHEGLFKRIGYDLEGRLEDYLNPDLPSSCTVLKLDLTFDTCSHVDIYKQNVIKSLCAAAGISVNIHAPLLDKDLAFVQRSSPAIQGLKQHDFACILLTISQYDWDGRVTPVIVRWFIREFCATELPPESPTFLFFFAIKYEENDEVLKDDVRKLVNDSSTVNALPELNMVSLRDIGKWFEKYKHIEPDTRKRQEKLKTAFPGAEFYMEDVELQLQRIIDEYNKKIS